MVSPKPISIVAGTAAPGYAPEPLALVGPLPVKSQIAALTAVTAPDAAAAAGATPTKAEFDVLVTLANANKAKINQVITAAKA